MMKDFATELAIMVKLRSPRIVSVYGVVTTDSSWLGLVVEYCAGGDLREALDADDAASIDEAQRRSWLSDIALGMAYLYSKGVEHRDLKALNVLLDGARRCKVTDFGLSKSESLATAATQATAGGDAKGTPAYMAPELLQHNIFTEKGDVYAYGMIVFEVLTGDTPWSGLNQMQIMMQVCIQKERPTIDGDAPADLVALMRRCWDHEPDARPPFAQIKAELASGAASPAASRRHLTPTPTPQRGLAPVEEQPAAAPVDEETRQLQEAMALSEQSLEQERRRAQEQQEQERRRAQEQQEQERRRAQEQQASQAAAAAQQPQTQPAETQPQRTVMIQVPPGCGPGMPLQIRTPTGQIVQIVVPAGAGPGSQFQVGY